MEAASSTAAGGTQFTIWLEPARRETTAAPAALRIGQLPLGERRYLSRAELRRDHDADPHVRSAICERLAAVGTLTFAHDWRRIELSGSRADCTLAKAALKSPVVAHAIVAVLDHEPAPRLRRGIASAPTRAHLGHAIADVAKAYGFPLESNGHGQTIGVISLRGAWHRSDLESAMHAAQLEVPIVCGDTKTARRSTDDLELALDTQIIATVANGATIALYAASNDPAGFVHAIARALLDVDRAPQIVTLSYGVPEIEWPPDALRCIEHLLIAAALCGVSVVAASGDSGAPIIDGIARVDYPASSRFVLACGGTDLRLARGRRVRESVWNDGLRASGGGYSRMFERTPWASQRGAHMRGVPDVAAHAASLHGYRIHLDGEVQRVGGTSAAAPLWASLLSVINAGAALPCGFVTPRLYEPQSRKVFHDVTVGENGRYKARRGWDACTGLGTPHGNALLRMLRDTQTSRSA